MPRPDRTDIEESKQTIVLVQDMRADIVRGDSAKQTGIVHGSFPVRWRADRGGEPLSPPRSSLLLRHPFHRAPAFERGPDAMFEPEAVDRHRRAERADAAQADTRPLEAALFQHPA